MIRTSTIKHMSVNTSSFSSAYRGIILIISALLITGQVKATGAPAAAASKLLLEASQSNIQLSSTRSEQWGLGTDLPVPGDYDGDDKADLAVFRPSAGSWYILHSSDNATTGQQFGIQTDQPVPADYDGDGKTDLAVFRPSNGGWYLLQSSNNTFRGQSWGTQGDVPSPGDYDGDGKSDFAVFRPSNGNWYILQSINNSSRTFYWGQSGDAPLNADYDGDGKSDATVFRYSNGTFYSWLSSDNSFRSQQWGISTDRPVTGDFDKDGKADFGIFRPSNATWYLLKSSDNSMFVETWGQGDDRLAVQDYDGNGQSDVAVFSPSSGTWNILLNPIPPPTPPQNVVSYPNAFRNLTITPSKSVYYRFSETSGTSIADSSGGSHTGTRSGSVSLNQSSLLTSDQNPSALFTGGKVLSTGFMPAPTTGLTLSCLVSMNAFGAAGRNQLLLLGASASSGMFQVTSSSSFNYSFIATDGAVVGFSLPSLAGATTGRIYHVAVTQDFASKTVKMYLDGILISTSTYTKTPRTAANQPVQISNDNVNSYIDEALVIADKVLSDNDIHNLFRAARGVDSSATAIYVSPSGHYRATGTSDDPIDLYTAIRSGYAKPGGSYNLKAGDYIAQINKSFPVIVHGTPTSRLTIQNNPGEHARILQPFDATSANFALKVTPLAQYVDFVGNWSVVNSRVGTFEITNLGTDRKAATQTTSQPPDEVNGRGAFSLIRWDTTNSRMIGLMIHDGGVGCDITQTSGGNSWHDIVGFNNGSDHGALNQTGMTFYTQNQAGVQRFVNNVSFRDFNYNFQGYGKTGNVVGIHIEGGIYFDGGAPAGALRNDPNFRQNNIFIGSQTTPQQDTLVTNVDTYMAPLARGANINIGYIYPYGLDATITNNRVFGGAIGISLKSHASGTVTGNFIYTRRSDMNVHYNGLTPGPGATFSNFTWNNNNYYNDPLNGGGIWHTSGIGYATLALWRAATGFDSNASVTNAAYTGTTVTPHVSEYRVGFGSLAIANFSQAATVNVNLSSFGLVNGQTVTIIDLERVLESDAVVKTLVYNSGVASTSTAVPVNILNTQPTQPYGVTGITRNREFRAYMVIPG